MEPVNKNCEKKIIDAAKQFKKKKSSMKVIINTNHNNPNNHNNHNNHNHHNHHNNHHNCDNRLCFMLMEQCVLISVKLVNIFYKITKMIGFFMTKKVTNTNNTNNSNNTNNTNNTPLFHF